MNKLNDEYKKIYKSRQKTQLTKLYGDSNQKMVPVMTYKLNPTSQSRGLGLGSSSTRRTTTTTRRGRRKSTTTTVAASSIDDDDDDDHDGDDDATDDTEDPDANDALSSNSSDESDLVLINEPAKKRGRKPGSKNKNTTTKTIYSRNAKPQPTNKIKLMVQTSPTAGAKHKIQLKKIPITKKK